LHIHSSGRSAERAGASRFEQLISCRPTFVFAGLIRIPQMNADHPGLRSDGSSGCGISTFTPRTRAGVLWRVSAPYRRMNGGKLDRDHLVIS